jgi:hypothetical protein
MRLARQQSVARRRRRSGWQLQQQQLSAKLARRQPGGKVSVVWHAADAEHTLDT